MILTYKKCPNIKKEIDEVKIYVILIIFHNCGFFEQMSKGCIP